MMAANGEKHKRSCAMDHIIHAQMKGETSVENVLYMQATIKETLHAPIPLFVPRMNLEEAKLGGFTIPEESKVAVNAWWLANNPDWWEKPSEFRPERFLEEDRDTESVVGGKVDFRFASYHLAWAYVAAQGSYLQRQSWDW
ncbi:hypothetical protein D5086_012452 [Populus alba]|uniref:Uncharacterized protein n=1 Tax=Populus alba TaxID=43335 RepID=A0ACC4C2P0_POPAL